MNSVKKAQVSQFKNWEIKEAQQFKQIAITRRRYKNLIVQKLQKIIKKLVVQLM